MLHLPFPVLSVADAGLRSLLSAGCTAMVFTFCTPSLFCWSCFFSAAHSNGKEDGMDELTNDSLRPVCVIKEYYEIANRSLPSMGILDHIDANQFYRNAFLYSKKLSNLPSFRAILALIASRATFENHFSFFLSYC